MTYNFMTNEPVRVSSRLSESSARFERAMSQFSNQEGSGSVDFSADRMLTYFGDNSPVLHPLPIDSELYDVKFNEQSKTWVRKKLGSNIHFCEEAGSSGLEYFVYSHDHELKARTVEVRKVLNGEANLCEVEINGIGLCFFYELPDKVKPKNFSSEALCKLTAFVSAVNSVVKGNGDLEINRIKSSSDDQINPNEYRVKAKIIELEKREMYLEQEFDIYVAEIGSGNKRLEIPIVFEATTLESLGKSTREFRTKEIIDCNIILQGKIV